MTYFFPLKPCNCERRTMSKVFKGYTLSFLLVILLCSPKQRLSEYPVVSPNQ